MEFDMGTDLENFKSGREIMKALALKNRAALCDITQDVSKREYQENPEKFEKLKGIKLLAFRERFTRKRRYLTEFWDEYILEQKKKRDLALDVTLIQSSVSTVDILGINALGPLHLGQEQLKDFLNDGGKARILLLNPISPAFTEREELEELHNGFIAGRLRAEYNASIGICKEIINFTDFQKNIEIKEHDQTPIMALVISDRNEKHAVLNCNIYPKGKNVRGLMGPHRLNVSKMIHSALFDEYMNYFNELWKNGSPIEEIELFIKKCMEKLQIKS
jgi:hypothetical protein